ncbi:MAG: hypothetical protein EXQ74_03775 [Thermoleophilia bacterium]|nr:hypothetical protein [Thermoleophilia bacterium]
MTTPIVVGAAAVAWLAVRQRNPARWPALVISEAASAVRDAREAMADAARAGVRTEHAFDDDMGTARGDARVWD